jgi:hypothetical protein
MTPAGWSSNQRAGAHLDPCRHSSSSTRSSSDCSIVTLGASPAWACWSNATIAELLGDVTAPCQARARCAWSSCIDLRDMDRAIVCYMIGRWSGQLSREELIKACVVAVAEGRERVAMRRRR